MGPNQILTIAQTVGLWYHALCTVQIEPWGGTKKKLKII